MQEKGKFTMTDSIFDAILSEILHGEYKRDTLPESGLGLHGEFEAMYFHNMREWMKSDIAHLIMSYGTGERRTYERQ